MNAVLGQRGSWWEGCRYDRWVRRGSLGGAGVMLALALALLLPAAVQGQEDRSPTVTGFHLRASNGFELLALAGTPPEGEEGWIGLFLMSGDRHSAVTYAAPATVTRRTIDVDLGKLGRISVVRVPTGGTKTVRLGCEPETKRVPAERYEGTVEFHGEEGFADVNAVSAPLDPNPCGVVEEGGMPPGKILPGARLHAEKERVDEYEFDFSAVQNRPGAKTEVGAEVEEHHEEMEIHRATWTWAGADLLRYDRRLRTATVGPPAPFFGHGSFRVRPRGRNLWSGNLAVDLPGRADVPLTGPGFLASLEHPRR